VWSRKEDKKEGERREGQVKEEGTITRPLRGLEEGGREGGREGVVVLVVGRGG
jgi:hypothetical protein